MILRFRIGIAVFDNPATIAQVVDDCLAQTPFPVLVVDDGSAVEVRSWLNSAAQQAALSIGRLEVLRFRENRGKGAALQSAFADSLARGFTHLLALDADGQHLVSEAWKLVRAAQENPWDLVIGNRRLGGVDVPQVSRFGRKFSNFWVGFQTAKSVADSQSGLRVYPLFRLQGLRWFTRRFDFEIEVLIRLLWRGVEAREVEVEVFYPKPSERVSHFDKLRDNVRISCLNTVLVVLSLLRSHGTPARLGLDVGIGVWLGCTPFLGLHTVLAAVLAVCLRANFVALWVGSQISIAPLLPLLIVASIRVGAWMTGVPTEAGSQAFARNWLFGSMLVGLALGAVFGSATYLACRSFRLRGSQKQGEWNGRTRGGKFGNFVLISFARRMGLPATYLVLRLIVPYFYLFAPRARRAAAEYWRAMRPEAGGLARQRLVIAQLYCFAQVLIDRIYQGFFSESKFALRAHGIENILGPVQAGEGLVLLSGHVGGWDLAGAALPWDGFRGDLRVVRYEARELTLEKVRNQPDPSHLRNLIVNETAASMFQIRQSLAEGKAVALMGDRPLGASVELVPFLGGLLPVDSTPFRVAAACRARLLFTFGFKAGPAAYDLFATPSRRYGSLGTAAGEASTPNVAGESTAGIHPRLECWEGAQAYAAELERLLRKFPEQWFNFYAAFSSRPQPPRGLEAAPVRAHLLEELRKPGPERFGSAADARPSA